MLWIVILLIISTVAKADDTLMHFAAHTGASYALSTVFYGACTRLNVIKPWDGDYSPEIKYSLPGDHAAKPTNRPGCLMLSGFATAMVGFLYKHFEKPQDTPAGWKRSMLFNGIGIAGSIGSILVFDF